MNVYEIITEQIVKLLEEGTIPWKKPWNASRDLPRNFVSGRRYTGINVWLLLSKNYCSPYWLTFNQIKKLDGKVKKGEKSSIVVLWNWINKKEKTATGEEEEKLIPFIKYYRVFNFSQTEGIDEKDQNNIVDSDDENDLFIECEKIIHGYKKAPTIEHSYVKAFYRPSEDKIGMPPKNRFNSDEEYFSTLFHEAIHSTGHPSRLNRKGIAEINSFGSEEYSQEELVAEMGSAFLCGVSGISPRTLDNQAAYIEGWLSALKNDSRLITIAAAQAQKAADYILGIEYPSNKNEQIDGE